MNVGRLATVLAALESVMDGCSGAKMTDIVLPSRNVSYNELIECYEELLQGTTMIIRNPTDGDDMSHYVTYIGGLVVTDAEIMYAGTVMPGEASDQLEREEALANYKMSQEILGSLIIDLELEVDPDDLQSKFLDAAIDNEPEDNPCDNCECNTCSFEKENYCAECDGCEKGRKGKNPNCNGVRK